VGVQRLRLVVAVIVLGFVLALALGSAGLLGGGRALGSSTTITVIGGDVSVRHGTSGAFVTAVDGEVLNAGDAVRTGTDARAVLTYFEGSTVTIEPNTELSIEEAGASNGSTRVSMKQDFGRTWHVVTHLVTTNSKYEVRTPASTASVRGTAFAVDSDGTNTTITTTEGTVVDQVPDPQNAGRTVDVPVPAGQQHSQGRGQGAGPTQQTPEPDRKVTITLSEQNTIVIDTLGRANGIDKDGKKVLQTPGATLEVIDGRLVITLPNIPDGRLQALARKQGGGDVDIQTVVTDHGNSTTSNGKISADPGNGQGRGNVDVTRGTGGDKPSVQQTQAPSPTPTETATPAPTEAAGGGGGGPPGGTTGGGQGQGGPKSTPGFVPPSALPNLPPLVTPTPTPKTPGGPASPPPGQQSNPPGQQGTPPSQQGTPPSQQGTPPSQDDTHVKGSDRGRNP